MDIICPRCGEPWDTDEVYHGMTADERARMKAGGGCSTACAASEPVRDERTAAGAAVLELLGDDLDGAASLLADLVL